MPAQRSRTDRWRDSLQQILERGGGIEFSPVAPDASHPQASGSSASSEAACEPGAEPVHRNVVWRVRLLAIRESELVVELAAAFGQAVHFPPGTHVAGVIAVGQNRWMFRTKILGECELASPRGRVACVRLAMPEHVERCQRRNFCRVSTVELHLPAAECYPLLDPSSVVAAEVANRALVLRAEAGDAASLSIDDGSPVTLPEVGPSFRARLMNIGGGGMGLIVDRAESAGLDRSRLFWVRLRLQPEIPIPLGLTARLAHTHLDSEQNVYAGMAYDFAANPSHREFIASQMLRYVEAIQKRTRLAA
ncbi:MAG: hypothetical protein SFZ23_07170 [Planctomycetota bacterium]|nr:hypothetical protein [Planctomycetota bacterium]